MYSPHGGKAFLQSYVADRIERLLLLSESIRTGCFKSEARAHNILHALLNAEGDFPVSKLEPLLFTPVVKTEFESQAGFPATYLNLEPVNTVTLLDALLNSFLDYSPNSTDGNTALHWLGRLLQRFEVSKKLYTVYLPGFRKGKGADDDVILYRKFALILALAFAQRKELQHLSTLLKVNDLLLSLPHEAQANCDGFYSLVLAVSVEVYSVQNLAEKHGVSIDVE